MIKALGLCALLVLTALPEEIFGNDLSFEYSRENTPHRQTLPYIPYPQLSYENRRTARSVLPQESLDDKDNEDFLYLRVPRSFLMEEEPQPHQEYFLAPKSDIQEEAEEIRVRRSLQGGAPQFPGSGGNNGGNHAGVDLSRQGPDTHATINAQHSTDRYEVGGQWSKVVRGPNKAKPDWNVRGAIKW